MPSYDYRCGKCQRIVTMVAGVNKKIDPPICSACKTEMQKIFTAPPIQFKGQGFNSARG